MPTPSEATLQVVRNAGAPETGVVVAAFGDSVVLKLADTSGVKKAKYRIYEYPEGFACPAGWTAGELAYELVVFNGGPTPAFSLPASDPDLGGQYLFDVEVNGRLRNGSVDNDLYDDATVIEIPFPSGSGLKDVAYLAHKQFDAKRGWAGALKFLVRFIDQAIFASGTLPLPGTTGNVLTSNGLAWISASASIFDITAFSTTTLVETSQSITPAFTSAQNITPTTLTLTNNANGESKNVVVTPTSFSTSIAVQRTTPNQTYTYTLTGSDGLRSDAASVTITWGQRNFGGVAATGSSLATIVAAASYTTLDTNGTFSFAITSTGGSQRGVFAFATRYGTPTVTDNDTGFGVGITLIGTSSYTNAQGYSENYDRYELDSPFIGTKTFNVAN
jgi:hypothetical protein